MRASGMSIGQITLAIFKVALLLSCLMTFLGETFIPRLSYIAHNQKWAH